MLQVGQSLCAGRYEITQVLPRDTATARYRAADHGAFRRAVVLIAQPASVDRAVVRARVGLHHPALPRTITVANDPAGSFLVQEDIAGQPPGERSLPASAVRRLGLALCNLCAYLGQQRPPLAPVALEPAHLLCDSTGAVRFSGDIEQVQGDGAEAERRVVMALAATLQHLADDAGWARSIAQHAATLSALTQALAASPATPNLPALLADARELHFDAGHKEATRRALVITNNGQHYVEAPIRVPVWLRAEPEQLALAPGEYIAIALELQSPNAVRDVASATVSVGDMGAELLTLRAHVKPRRPSAWLWSAAGIALCLLVVAGLVAWRTTGPQPLPHVATAQLALGGKIAIYDGGGDATMWSRFSPDDQSVVAYGGDITFWRVDDGQRTRALDPGRYGTQAIALSPDGILIAIGSARQAVLKQVSDGHTVRTLGASLGGVSSAAFSPDGQLLATRGSSIQLWRVRDGALIGEVPLNGYAVAWSPDGTMLAAGGDGGTVQIFQTVSLSLVQKLAGHYGDVGSIAWSPDGRHLASGSADATIKLWRVADGALERTFEGHRAAIRSVAFAAGGAVLISGGAEGAMRVWRVDDGTLLQTIQAHPYSVESVNVTRDGMTVASSGWDDKSIKLWSLKITQ